jgi:hypothetical protein
MGHLTSVGGGKSTDVVIQLGGGLSALPCAYTAYMDLSSYRHLDYRLLELGAAIKRPLKAFKRLFKGL